VTFRGESSGPMLRRLRTLTEDECYTRCYGSGDATVRIVKILPRHKVARFEHLSGEDLRRLFEIRLDAREPEAA
jgi:hypothetical protein